MCVYRVNTVNISSRCKSTGSNYSKWCHMIKKAYIEPPKKIPIYIKLGLIIARKATGKDLLPPKLLAWYPKAAISSGVLEALVAHGHPTKDLSTKILQLIRVQVSIQVGCPFCIDMNSVDYLNNGITEEEMQGLSGLLDLDLIPSLSEREKTAILYTKMMTQTPIECSDAFMKRIKDAFSEREIVMIVSTAAQVNYWARLIKALGVPPAGFM